METVRAFIAIDIGDEIRKKLEGFQRTLKKVTPPVRWVDPRNIHLTLAFLGELPLERITPLKTALDEAFHGLDPFVLEAAGSGFFGRPRRPSTLWAGITDCPPLMALQQRTVNALRVAELEFDHKPFSPHLTLGRIKAPGHAGTLLQILEQAKAERFGHTCIDAVELIQSELKPSGAEYSVLHRVPLSLPGNP
jgi:2'-5' RNA ligase